MHVYKTAVKNKPKYYVNIQRMYAVSICVVKRQLQTNEVSQLGSPPEISPLVTVTYYISYNEYCSRPGTRRYTHNIEVRNTGFSGAATLSPTIILSFLPFLCSDFIHSFLYGSSVPLVRHRYTTICSVGL